MSVNSVNTRTGDVVLTKDDVGLDNIDLIVDDTTKLQLATDLGRVWAHLSPNQSFLNGWRIYIDNAGVSHIAKDGEDFLASAPVDQFDLHVKTDDEAITALNSWPVTHPLDTPPPFVFCNNQAKYGASARTGLLGPSIAFTGVRLWSVYCSTLNTANKPADEVEGSFIVVQYSDDYTRGNWSETLYLTAPDEAHSHVRDPQLFTLPDGRLLVTAYVGADDDDIRNCGYGFLINNPMAKVGSFEIGRISFLDYGVPGAPCMAGPQVRYSSDEWAIGLTSPPAPEGQGKHYSYLDFSERDLITSHRIADAPYDAPQDDVQIQDFDESSAVPISAARTRYFWRTRGDGADHNIRTALSNVGDTTFGASDWWDASDAAGRYISVKSRSHFRRLDSGRIGGCFNRASTRINLTLVLSEDEGQSFLKSCMIESRVIGGTTPAYPNMISDGKGNVLIAYDFGRLKSNSGGTNIIVAVVNENLVHSGTATENDVTKYVIAQNKAM